MAELIFLSIIQGVTEFLPISSSAHLILISKYFYFNNSNLTLDVSMHLGSLLAIIFYFKEILKNFINNIVLLKKIIITSIPVLLAGFIMMKLDYTEIFRNYKIIGWSTLIFGLLLLLSDFKKTNQSLKSNFTYKNALLIGLFQILSLIPGVSRAGITITVSRFLNFNRIDSAKISFLSSIPVLGIISSYNLQKIISQDSFEVTITNLIAVILSFFFSLITIKFFLIYLKKFSLFIFVIYRVILGIAILIYVYN